MTKKENERAIENMLGAEWNSLVYLDDRLPNEMRLAGCHFIEYKESESHKDPWAVVDVHGDPIKVWRLKAPMLGERAEVCAQWKS